MIISISYDHFFLCFLLQSRWHLSLHWATQMEVWYRFLLLTHFAQSYSDVKKLQEKLHAELSGSHYLVEEKPPELQALDRAMPRHLYHPGLAGEALVSYFYKKGGFIEHRSPTSVVSYITLMVTVPFSRQFQRFPLTLRQPARIHAWQKNSDEQNASMFFEVRFRQIFQWISQIYFVWISCYY